jgi:hypothetical protein
MLLLYYILLLLYLLIFDNDGHQYLVSVMSVAVVDPVDLEYVLKTCLEKDDLHRFIRCIIGNGGIFAPGMHLYIARYE